MKHATRQKLRRLLNQSDVLLTEGSVIERIKRFGHVPLDSILAHAPFVYRADGRAALADLHRQYIAIGQRYGLPLLTFTDTWRANAERLRTAGLADRDVNGDCVRFLRGIVAETGANADRICIGGLIGCKGDAYRPSEALAADQAELFHTPQIASLAAAGVDFLFAATLPALSEAIGIARAMCASGVPYAISFVLNRNGCVLDGTPLDEAVAALDGGVPTPPLFHMANCCHPTHFRAAMVNAVKKNERLRNRILGLQANTSSKDFAELDNLAVLDSEDPESFANAMIALHRDFGTRILGGCCGSDDRHISEIAKRLAPPQE